MGESRATAKGFIFGSILLPLGGMLAYDIWKYFST